MNMRESPGGNLDRLDWCRGLRSHLAPAAMLHSLTHLAMSEVIPLQTTLDVISRLVALVFVAAGGVLRCQSKPSFTLYDI